MMFQHVKLWFDFYLTSLGTKGLCVARSQPDYLNLTFNLSRLRLQISMPTRGVLTREKIVKSIFHVKSGFRIIQPWSSNDPELS